jgi:hypothetical protein
MPSADSDPLKDEDDEYPIPNVWRSTLQAIVDAIAEGDYELSRGIPFVATIASASAKHIREYIEDYAGTLVRLPEESWSSSVYRWMRTHWHVVVDLWTLEEGRSDLALIVHIFEAGEGFRFEVESVHVP